MENQIQESQQQSVEFDYSKIKDHLKQLISDWKSVVNTGGVTVTDTGSTLGATSDQFKGEETTSRIRRELRRDNRDLPIMRARGELPPDGNYIPQRVIDQQIAREKPSQIAFLEQPERLLIFKDITNPDQPTEDIERFFTDHMRYPGWTIPWHRAFDSIDLHGGTCLEVITDPTKPFYCRIEYIRREDLIFPVEATDIQGCEAVMRRYRYMPFELERFQKEFGFNPAAIKEVLSNTEHKRHQKLEVFKCYMKRDGIVYIFWFAEACQQYFLKNPEPYTLGICDPEDCQTYLDAVSGYEKAQEELSQMQITTTEQAIAANAAMQAPPPEPPTPLPESDYPVFFLPYEVIEDDRLLATKGLAFKHRSDQEASSELWTNIINATNRAAGVYASFSNDPMRQQGINKSEKIIPGTIQQREVKFWSFPWPDSMLLAVAQALSSNISAQSNSVDYAVTTRKGDKTAREIEAASNQSAQQKSVGISGQSLTVLQIYELCWKIGRTYVLLGEIKTFNIVRDRMLHRYVLSSAGDSDVIRREGRKAVIRETFQYVVGTPVANQFLIYLVNTFFPEQAREWVPMLKAQDPVQLVQVALKLLENMPRESISPEQSSQLDQLLELFRQYIGTRTGNVQAGAPDVVGASSDTTPQNLPSEESGSVSGAVGSGR